MTKKISQINKEVQFLGIKLTGVKGGINLTDSEVLDIGRLLLKAGYTIKIQKKRPPGKNSGAYDKYIVISGGDLSAAK